MTLLLALAALPPLLGQDGKNEPLPERAPLAFVQVDVLTPDATALLRDQTVLIQDGRITRVGRGADVEIPPEARLLHGEGRTLLPGLVEMHGHLPGPNWPADLIEDVLFLYVANGVSSVRGMLGDAAQLELKGRIAAGEVLGPRLWVGSPPLTGGNTRTVEEARERVRAYHADGYDHLKIHEGLTPDVYAAIAETARELGMPFGGHVPDLVGLYGALEAGQATIDHLDNLVEALVVDDEGRPVLGELSPEALARRADEELMVEVVTRLKASGAAVVPTQELWRTIHGGLPGDELLALRPECAYMPRSIVDQWVLAVNQYSSSLGGRAGLRILELRDRFLGLLDDAGVPILLGTDSPQSFSVPGFSIHRELRALERAPLAIEDVLRAGTQRVARFYGAEDDFGSVAVGRRADLILVDGNPLEDLGVLERPAGVVLDGRWLEREELDRRLAQVAERSAGR